MDKVKRFFECLIPVPVCNIRCHYCYISQRNGRNKKPTTDFKYTPAQIVAALSRDRLGGTCYFSLCGSGETLVPYETIAIAHGLLRQGHFVNITTNGLLSQRFDKLLAIEREDLERLHISFSFHYLELAQKWLDIFFNNISKVREAGSSFFLQFNLCDEYLPHLDEIRRLCVERAGAPPQIAATRKEHSLQSSVELYTEHSREEYHAQGRSFDSPLFDFTMKNFGVKRTEFCYAGDWSASLNLATGQMRRCYASNAMRQDVFANPRDPIRFQAIGEHCRSLFCMNSSHFMSLGVIPSVDAPSYASLRDRSSAGWYTDRMRAFLSSRLCESNETYSSSQVTRSNALDALEKAYALKQTLGSIYRKATRARRA
jgi:organic radical activating enzyme